MRPVQHTVRLSSALDRALRVLAERHDMSVYAMLQRSVKAGVASLADSSESDALPREIITELASVSTRLVEMERVLDRALYTACAAYCYARSAALGAGKTDDMITAEVNAAYDRQHRLSQGGRS